MFTALKTGDLRYLRSDTSRFVGSATGSLHARSVPPVQDMGRCISLDAGKDRLVFAALTVRSRAVEQHGRNAFPPRHERQGFRAGEKR